MPDMRMQLIIEALNKTDAAFNALKGQLKDAGAETQGAAQKTAGLELNIKRLIATATGIGSIAALFLSVKKVIGESLEFLGLLETATLGIASGFISQGKYIDQTTGKALSAQDSLKAAQQDARGVLEELQVANFQTIATLDQLVRAYQETLPVAISKGFDRKQVKEFTVAVVQAAGAIGLSMDMLAEETRSLLTGTIVPRTSRVAVALGITSEDIRQNSANARQLFDYLMKRLDAYRIAGIESQNTWAGLWSNIKDIAKQAGGMAFQPLFEAVKYELKEITDYMISIDEKMGKIKWNPEFIDSIKEAKENITSVIAGVYRLGMLLDKIGGTLTMILSRGTKLEYYATFGLWKEAGKKSDYWKEQNKELEERYKTSERALMDMAMREEGYKRLTKEMQDFAAKKRVALTIVPMETPEYGQKLQYVKDEELKNIGWRQGVPKKSEEEQKEAIASARFRMQLRLDTLKNEEKLEQASIDTRKAMLEQQYQSAEVETETYLNRKKELEAEALRYSIANDAKEADAVKKGYGIVIANEDDKANKIKIQSELTQKLGAIKNDVAIKEEKLNQLGIAGATELIKLKQDLAKIERDSRLSALEEEKTIADKRIQYQEEAGKISTVEAVKQRYDWELKILELKRENLLIDMMAEGDTRKKEKLYSDYLEVLKKINTLPERKQIDTGLSQLAAEKEAFETIKDFASGYQLFQEKQLDKIAAKMRNAGIAEVDIERWKTDEIKRLTLQRYQFILEHTDSMGEAVKAKFAIMAINLKSQAQVFADGFGEIFDGAFQTINSVFFDALEGRMASFADYMQTFRKIVNRVIADIITQLLRMGTMKLLGFGSSGLTGGGLLGLLGGIFGGGSSYVPGTGMGDSDMFMGFQQHAGGLPGSGKYRLVFNSDIVDMLPRRHSGGLASDERLVVNKINERYISEEQNEWLTGIARALTSRGSAGNIIDIGGINAPVIVPFDNKKLQSSIQKEIENEMPRIVMKVIKEHI
ncbi:MAG: hypothetical protein ABIJ37_03080 [Pseudomonadota bacterium]